jgi:site-specific recombinase XerD
MSLELYRRHNSAATKEDDSCTSTDTQKCDDSRHPCPIWVRGTGPDGKFIRQSLRRVTGSITRDWALGLKAIREWEEKGKAPKPANARATIQQLRDDFTAKIKGENLSNETVRKYKTLFDQLNTFVADKGVRFVDELDYQMLMDFRKSWSDGPLSTGKKLERLRGIMKFAVMRKWASENYAMQIKSPKVELAETLPFSPDEMQAILKAAETPEMRAFVLTMRFSGLRISDTAKLALANLQNGKISLPRQKKTRTPVSVKLNQLAVDELLLMKPKSPKYFFWSGTSSERTLVSVWGEKLRTLFKDAGIVNGHSHRFRDTFAVGLFESGATTEDVSRLLGHSSIKITEKHYNPWIKSRQDKLDAVVDKANGWHELQKQKPATVVPIRRKRA